MSMRHPCTFQRQTDVGDDFGEFDTWRDEFHDLVERNPTSGAGRQVARQMSESVTEIVRMRWRPGITPDMRLVFGEDGAVVEIERVIDEDNQHRFLVLGCSRSGADVVKR